MHDHQHAYLVLTAEAVRDVDVRPGTRLVVEPPWTSPCAPEGWGGPLPIMICHFVRLADGEPE